ncbi:hypothetical protein FACS1894162_1840 [Bacteroidia bacterium]|nr:hypothetical protein FACS1894162_1840 [Bacteroidia bacterium]
MIMIKKQFLFLFIIGIVAGNGFAKQRTTAEALNEAQAFVQSQPDLRSSASETLNRAETGLNTPYYYVFNRSNNTGFVIIAGDDRAKTVLGYSDNGHFDVENLPSNIKYWLGEYENQLQALAEGKIMKVAESTPQFRADNNFRSSIAPLIQTQWDQNTPYNNLCPLVPNGKPNAGQKTITGCAATALAQIIKFHQYPTSYNFSNSYTTTSLGISINETFSGTYDWANMINTYDAYNYSSTVAQNDAVAALMYHCGVAVDMDYNTGADGGSSASTFSPAAALTQKFDYDPNLQYYSRDFYTEAEWVNLLKTDLNTGLPLLYGGQSNSNGGHQFICDGYDINDYFHFNWGWNGEFDGYYALSALNPSGLSGDGFNYGQVIVTGIQPPNPASTPPPYQIIADTMMWTSVNTTSRTGIFDLQTGAVFNLGTNTVPANSYFGFGLYNANQALVDTNYAKAPFEIALFHGLSFENVFTNVYIPASIPNGDYRFYLIYSLDKINWTKIRVDRQYAPYLPVTLTNTNVIFTSYTEIKTPVAEENQFVIYPNPVEDILFVHSQTPVETLVIVDITGKTVLKHRLQSSEEISVPVNQLPAGIYILQAKTQAGISSVKFIKK